MCSTTAANVARAEREKIRGVKTALRTIFTYLEDREVLLDSPTATFLMSLQSFGAALEREKATLRAYDTPLRKARAGTRHRWPGVRIRKR